MVNLTVTVTTNYYKLQNTRVFPHERIAIITINVICCPKVKLAF